MSDHISSLALTIAAAAAMAAAYIAYRAFLRAANSCSEAIRLADLAVDNASSAVAALRLAIDNVSSSRESRRAEAAIPLASSCSLSQTRENLSLSSGTSCEPESIIRTDSSPSATNATRQAACLGSVVVMCEPPCAEVVPETPNV